VFRAYQVYVVSVNDVGPAVTAPQLVTAYTGEGGLYCLLHSVDLSMHKVANMVT